MQRLPIDQSKVDNLIRQCKHLNVFAVDLPYYYLGEEKPNPVSSLMTELVEECIQYLSIMTEEEIRSLVSGFPPGVRVLVGYDDGIDNHFSLDRVAIGYLVAVVQESYLSFKQIISGDTSDSKLLQEYPELHDKLDDDGLLILDGDFRPSDVGIGYKDHVIQYHQFLRRGYRANPNFSFLGRFVGYYLQTEPRNQFRVAIDFHRLMPKEALRHILEMDTWFGAIFDRSKLDEPNATGLTVVKRIKPSIFDTDNDLDRTEFYWSRRDEIKTLEVEELSGESYLFDSYYLNRYVHSERDINERILRHFDGAVKVYLQDSYKNRLASQMPAEPRSFRKIKLFRIDGDIDIDEWIDLISFFYKGNEMIIEYFNPQQFEQLFGERIREYSRIKQSLGLG